MKFIILIIIYCFIQVIQSDFISKFNKEASVFKLQNYLKKQNLKKYNIINESTKENFEFVEAAPESIQEDTQDYDEFKAKIFAYNYKNKNSQQIYTPISVNKDEEHIPGWNNFIVLMKFATNSEINHKLVRVCFRQESQDSFAIVMNYDKSCRELVEKINNSNVLSNEMLTNLHNYEDKILSKNLRGNSFIEKSVTTEKTFTMDTLAHKFSMEDLTKIKSLIKFAKINNIMDEVCSHKGDIKIEELVNKSKIKTENTNTSISSFNNTELYKEFANLKEEVIRNNKKVDTFYNETTANMKNITNLVIFLKEISTEFHKSMLLMGNKLSNVSDTLVSNNKVVINDSNKLKFKQISNEITNSTTSTNNTKLVKPGINIKKEKEAISPFLAARDFGPTDDDEIIEKVENKLQKSYETGDDFINP